MVGRFPARARALALARGVIIRSYASINLWAGLQRVTGGQSVGRSVGQIELVVLTVTRDARAEENEDAI